MAMAPRNGDLPRRTWAEKRRSVASSGAVKDDGCVGGRDKGRLRICGDGGDSRWVPLEGDDTVCEAVREQHKLWSQIVLLGQGSPEGYVDHEFPPQPRSVDGLEPEKSKRSQEVLIDILSAERPDDDDSSDEKQFHADAPRCYCGRRSRRNRVRVQGVLAKRPYYRCAVRACRFFAQDVGPSVRAQGISWRRFECRPGRYVVVGKEGFRPEDARYGPEAEGSGGCLADALAVLAESPRLVARLLPNAIPGDETGKSCHEVRLCVDGLWRSILVDERLPVGNHSSSTAGVQLEPAFGRTAGNQLWLSLIEKAYAKVFGAYDFALPGAQLDEVIADLSGAPVEVLRFAESFEPDALWEKLRSLLAEHAIVACSTHASDGAGNVHTLLGMANAGDPLLASVGLGRHRAVRLRNPRAGFHTPVEYEKALMSLRGVPAFSSSHADGSFWVQYPGDFLHGFARAVICHSTSFAHTTHFEGEFDKLTGLGIRGCTLRIRCSQGVNEHVHCWLKLSQPTARGARLMRPAMGYVFNDVGMIVMRWDGTTGSPCGGVLGGAQRDSACSMMLEPGVEYIVCPFSLRALPGPVSLRIWAKLGIEFQVNQSENLASAAWNAVTLSLCQPERPITFAYGTREPSHSVHQLQVEGRPSCTVDLIFLRTDSATLAIIKNPHVDFAVLAEWKFDASNALVYTARGDQLGTSLGMFGPDTVKSDVWHSWRSYIAEDVVPPASAQMLCIVFSVAGECWKLLPGPSATMLMPREAAGSRPCEHAFAPRSLCRGQRPVQSRSEKQVALSSLGAGSDSTKSGKHAGGNGIGASGGRWARRARSTQALVNCVVCTEMERDASPVQCCRHQLCYSCACQWAHLQLFDQGELEVSCPVCGTQLDDTTLAQLLNASDFAAVQARRQEREAAILKRQPPTEEALGLSPGALVSLGVKRCPACGSGTQRESETCHKMICRTCRAKFCFRCLSRLEYFNCGCTGSEHRFVDPVDGSIVAHQ
eukprot:TRINITY_DN23029_c0_g1_i1.p1 TRINITY_DN23029_c0_g1~~TRINITY_DN23029_c0_g1_i1.p1  ORF type:complete len:1013 (-),score=80.87 TRINITY_DN23029_c0_g1_i1:257-3232(-)